MRLVQILDKDGEQLGLVETDLTDTELKRANVIVDADEEDGLDLFEKFEYFANSIGRDAKCVRVYVDNLEI